MSVDNEKLMVNYLLGELPEEDQLRIEKRFFTDDDYYQQMLALENELLYDYAAGGLAPEQRVKFERRLLNSPEARRKADLAIAAMDKVAEAGAQRASVRTTVTEERKSFWQSIATYLTLQNPLLQVSLAATSAVLVVGVASLFYRTLQLRTQVERLEIARYNQEQQRAHQAVGDRARLDQLAEQLETERRKRAQLEQDLANQRAQTAHDANGPSSASSTLFSFILSPGLVRGATGPNRLLVPANTDSLRLRLTLKRPGNWRAYRAALQTLDGAELWNGGARLAGSSASGRSVVLSLPAKIVPPGDYLLVLKGSTDGGEVEEIDEYYFSVARP